MRWIALAIPTALLMGCHGEPSFDERYDAANKKIHDAAADIDAQLSASATERPAPDGVGSASAAPEKKQAHSLPVSR